MTRYRWASTPAAAHRTSVFLSKSAFAAQAAASGSADKLARAWMALVLDLPTCAVTPSRRMAWTLWLLR
jgi:hypothetical protein